MELTNKPLEYSLVEKLNTKIDTWTGVRKSGSFFAYGEPTVNVEIQNNKTESKITMRGFRRGFYVTITTIDDSALYADFYEPLNELQMIGILKYFNKTVINGLSSNERMLKEIERIVGQKADGYDFS